MAPAGSLTEIEVGFESETRVLSAGLVRSGKYCHQCRQRTENFMAICRNTSKKPCPLHYCCRCLMNRYSENADQSVAMGEWHCPKCRGICNCSVCARKTDGNEMVAEVCGRIVVDSSLRSDEIPRYLIDLNCDPIEDASYGFEFTAGPNEASTSASPGTPYNGNGMNSYLGGNHFSSGVHVPMPLGIDVNQVASIKMSSEDVGHALQLLEFCKAFGQVFSLNDEDPELLIRDIFDKSNEEASPGPASIFQKKITSMIQEDREEQCLEPSIEINGDNDGEPSCKLRALNFLCDEALNTSVLRNWINTYKRDRETISLSESKVPCSPALEDNAEDGATQNYEFADPDKPPNKKFKSDAFRSEPSYVNACGQKFWNFGRSSNAMDIYVQDFAEELMAQDKWFKFNPQQKDLVEKYLAALRSPMKKKAA